MATETEKQLEAHQAILKMLGVELVVDWSSPPVYWWYRKPQRFDLVVDYSNSIVSVFPIFPDHRPLQTYALANWWQDYRSIEFGAGWVEFAIERWAAPVQQGIFMPMAEKKLRSSIRVGQDGKVDFMADAEVT